MKPLENTNNALCGRHSFGQGATPTWFTPPSLSPPVRDLRLCPLPPSTYFEISFLLRPASLHLTCTLVPARPTPAPPPPPDPASALPVPPLPDPAAPTPAPAAASGDGDRGSLPTPTPTTPVSPTSAPRECRRAGRFPLSPPPLPMAAADLGRALPPLLLPPPPLPLTLTLPLARPPPLLGGEERGGTTAEPTSAAVTAGIGTAGRRERGGGLGVASVAGGLGTASACGPVAGLEDGLLRACFDSLLPPPEPGVCLGFGGVGKRNATAVKGRREVGREIGSGVVSKKERAMVSM